MRKLLLLLLAVGGTACQHATPPTQARVAVPPPRPDATPVPTPGLEAAADTLAPAMRTLLGQVDLGPLLQTIDADSLQGFARDGFFGADHHRIEVAVYAAARDAQHPERYYLKGKTRYKKHITPFAGTLTFTQVQDQPLYTPQEVADPDCGCQNLPGLYTASGRFELREDSSARAGGIFRGQVAVDWQLSPTGEVRMESRRRTLTQGGGVKFEGQWTSYATHQVKPVVWVGNIFGYAAVREVLKDFSVGERMPEFNPKYARLGWDNYWENEEWWHEEAPAPLAPLAARPPDSLLAQAIEQ